MASSAVASSAVASSAVASSAALARQNATGTVPNRTPAFSSSTVFQVKPGPCSAINEAISRLPESGGTVRLSAGDFACTEPVVIDKDHVRLVGAGQAQTRLVMAAQHPAPVLVVGTLQVAPRITSGFRLQYGPVREVRDIQVSDLMVDGNLHEQPDPAKFECYDPERKIGLSCDGDGGKYIRNNGVTIRRARDVKIERVKAVRNLSGGMVIEKGCRELFVDQFSASQNAFDGFAGYETTASLFQRLTLEENHYSGVSLDLSFNGNIFDEAVIRNNGDNGIFSNQVGDNTFRNLIVEDNGNFGVYLSGVWRDGIPEPGTCDRNRFENSAFRRNHNSGIRVNHICQDIVLQDVTIQAGREGLDCLSLYPGALVKSVGHYTCTP